MDKTEYDIKTSDAQPIENQAHLRNRKRAPRFPSRLPNQLDKSGTRDDSWALSYLDVFTLLITFMAVLISTSSNKISDKNGNTPFDYSTGILQGSLGIFDATTQRSSKPDIKPVPATQETNLIDMASKELDEKEKELVANSAKSVFDVLQNQGIRESIAINTRDDFIEITLETPFLFESAEVEPSRQGLAILIGIADALADKDVEISVEGHTDSDPISTKTFPSNWELSVLRASAVARKLNSYGIKTNRLRVIGYADTKPLLDETGNLKKAEQRRVVLRVTPVL